MKYTEYPFEYASISLTSKERICSLTTNHSKQATPSLTEPILTARELASYLRLKEQTVYKLAASGELPGFKIGKSWRFVESEVQRFIKGETHGQRA